MNKRGDVQIGILVLLAVLVAGAALFSFWQSYTKDEVIITDARVLDNAYMKENQIRFYIDVALEKAIVESYGPIIAKANFVEAGNEIVFGLDMEELIWTNFRNEILKYEFKDPMLNDFKNKVMEGSFEISYSGDKVSATLSDMTISSSLVLQSGKRVPLWKFVPSPFEAQEVQQLAGVMYKPVIEERVRLEDMGLTGYDSIADAIKLCAGKTKEDLQNCLGEKLAGFKISVVETAGKQIVSFETKDSFQIGDKLESIKFSTSL